MAVYKVPGQVASGADTFSDGLVGFQITNGSNQLTNTNFTIDRSIPEKDSKNFTGQPFSPYFTLDDINQETTLINDIVTTTTDDTVKFKNSKNDGNRSLFGSLKQRINIAIQNIIKKYPAAVLIDGTSPTSFSNNTAESIIYDSEINTTECKIQYSLFVNQFDILFNKQTGTDLTQTYNDMRNFYLSYSKYVIVINEIPYNIVYYSEPDDQNKVVLKIDGDCFNVSSSGITEYTKSFIIRPNNGVVEEFYNGLDDLESILLNRESYPIYNATFYLPQETNGGYTSEITPIQINWPLSRDGWNIQIVGINFHNYINKLSDIADEVDNYKSNLIIRFLTSPQLFEFDTEDKKAESIFQIYGQSFDMIKKYIDNIRFMRNVSYDGVDNLPDIFLKDLSDTLGFSSTNFFNEEKLSDIKYTRYDTNYGGVSTGKNLIESEHEMYRRILVNLSQLYKSKGTRKTIEFFLKFIGAPEPMIKLDEYVYKVKNTLPSSDIETDIHKAILGINNFNVLGVSGLTTVTGSTTYTRNEYPVDSNGLPRKIQTSDGEMYFEKGAGWYQSTLNHRSINVLDVENSNLTGRTKTIKTMEKPFTYGEDYFNVYRNLPGLGYGFTLSSVIDNKKCENVKDNDQSKLTLNRKNINIFLSASNVLDYDIYRKCKVYSGMTIPYEELLLTDNEELMATHEGWNIIVNSFIKLGDDANDSFEYFLENLLSYVIKNSNVIKYSNRYENLDLLFKGYIESNEFIPYNYLKVNEYINQLNPNWIKLVEQFVPATTLWLGGNLIENSVFGRSKYRHKRPKWF